jgi:hypothetical protein
VLSVPLPATLAKTLKYEKRRDKSPRTSTEALAIFDVSRQLVADHGHGR